MPNPADYPNPHAFALAYMAWRNSQRRYESLTPLYSELPTYSDGYVMHGRQLNVTFATPRQMRNDAYHFSYSTVLN